MLKFHSRNINIQNPLQWQPQEASVGLDIGKEGGGANGLGRTWKYSNFVQMWIVPIFYSNGWISKFMPIKDKCKYLKTCKYRDLKQL